MSVTPEQAREMELRLAAIKARSRLRSHESNNPSVAELGRSEPERRGQETLVSAPQNPQRRKSRVGKWAVEIISFRPRLLDDDNLSGGAKPLRDAIAASLGLDDGDPRIKFTVYQVVSRAKGTEVVITRL